MDNKIALELIESGDDQKLNEFLAEWIDKFAKITRLNYAAYSHYTEAIYDNIDDDVSRRAFGISIQRISSGALYDGETFTNVYQLNNGNKNEPIGYFQISGCYSSWDNTEYDEHAAFVTPRKIIVTEFFTKEELLDAKNENVVFYEP